MPTGAITSEIDVAQVVLYAFWFFFAGLIFYLRREDKREGYPLETDPPNRGVARGFPDVPAPKTFHLSDGTTVVAPREHDPQIEIAAEPVEPWPGAPLQPTGNPMRDAVGPASYALRAEIPDTLPHGQPKIVPLRVAGGFHLDGRDTDPRGLPVIGGDNRRAGTVSDVWIDRGEPQIRYLEVEIADAPGKRPSPVSVETAAPAAPAVETDADAGPSDEPADTTEEDAAASEEAAGETAVAAEASDEAERAKEDASEAPPVEAAPAPRHVLLPIGFVRIHGGRRRSFVKVESILSHQFADVPATASAEQITRREEDRITAYYASGYLYAHPDRTEPLF